jgi:cytochrome c2/DNA-binding beta-propeller fold protein YncE
MSRDILWHRLTGLFIAVIVFGGVTAGALGATSQDQEQPKAEASTDNGAEDRSDIDALVAGARAEDGKLIARVCSNCHSVTPGGGHKIGPNLYGVSGRRVASVPNYPYSRGLTRHLGQTWTNENLNAYLANPKDWAPGTKMTFPGLSNAGERAAIIAYLRALPEIASRDDGSQDASAASQQASDTPTGPQPTTAKDSQRLTRDGLVIDLSVTPAKNNASGGMKLLQGDRAEVAFRITDEATGEPVSGLYPGAWLDLAKTWDSDQDSSMTCKYRASLYLQGQGFKPLIDMNSYYMLVLNHDASIMVFDPLVNVSGKTMLYAQINLEKPGADWVKSADEKWIFISMPRANQVAVVDSDVFKVKTNIDAGSHPVRVAMQPDGKYLWVGNDSKKSGESGVTVIDVDGLKTAAQIPTGQGHHEIAFSSDSRYAFISNRTSGTVSVIDVQKLEKVTDIRTGPQPISLSYSQLSESLYVVDGAEGIVSVIDPRSQAVTKRVKALPGLGPLRFTADGRWGFVVNTEQSLVHVIDASVNRIAQDISVGTRPYQIGFSRSFAYVRSLGTERVSMINLQELYKGRKPPIVTFPAGNKAPAEAPELNLADVIVEAPGEAAVIVVSPADATVYYYMEGMNAPSGAFRNYGHRPLAVMVVDQALREKEPGAYASGALLPHAGTYDIAFIMDSPQILHCFSVVAGPNPHFAGDIKPLAVEYLIETRKASVGEAYRLRFQLNDPATGRLRSGLKDIRVLYYKAPGQFRTEVAAKEVRDGLYEAELPIRFPGAYYVKVPYGELPYITFSGSRQKAAKQGSAPKGG